MTELEYNATRFKEDFPEFVNKRNPEIDRHIRFAKMYVSNCCLCECDQTILLGLMTAHLLTLMDNASSNNGVSLGSSSGKVASATIGSVSVSMVAPSNKNQYEFWINQTPYGQQYYSMLQAINPTGVYYCATNQRVFR